MAKTAPITIPSEPIGSITRPADLIERVAKGDSEDPNLAPLYADAIQDTIEQFKATGLRSLRTANRGSITISARTACMGFRTRPWIISRCRSQVFIRAACRGSHAALSVTGGTQTLTWSARRFVRTRQVKYWRWC